MLRSYHYRQAERHLEASGDCNRAENVHEHLRRALIHATLATVSSKVENEVYEELRHDGD